MAMKSQGVARRIGRLFVIKTRWEAWAVTWAIAVGAAERGKHYLALYPGVLGWIFFAICCAVVFVAGAKLLDATRDGSAGEQRRPARAAVAVAPRRERSRRSSHPVGPQSRRTGAGFRRHRD